MTATDKRLPTCIFLPDTSARHSSSAVERASRSRWLTTRVSSARSSCSSRWVQSTATGARNASTAAQGRPPGLHGVRAFVVKYGGLAASCGLSEKSARTGRCLLLDLPSSTTKATKERRAVQPFAPMTADVLAKLMEATFANRHRNMRLIYTQSCR